MITYFIQPISRSKAFSSSINRSQQINYYDNISSTYYVSLNNQTLIEPNKHKLNRHQNLVCWSRYFKSSSTNIDEGSNSKHHEHSDKKWRWSLCLQTFSKNMHEVPILSHSVWSLRSSSYHNRNPWPEDRWSGFGKPLKIISIVYHNPEWCNFDP